MAIIIAIDDYNDTIITDQYWSLTDKKFGRELEFKTNFDFKGNSFTSLHYECSESRKSIWGKFCMWSVISFIDYRILDRNGNF